VTLLALVVIALFIVLAAFLFKETLRMSPRQMLILIVCLIVVILIILMVNDNPMIIHK
jgi:hypothetical protein